MKQEPPDIGHDDELTGPVPPSSHDMAAAIETHSLGRLKFQPYTPTRVIAAQSMGLKYGFVDPAGIADYRATGIYPGMPRDIAIVLWLCFQTDPFAIDQAARNPVDATQAAIDWAFKKGFGDPRHEQFEAGRTIFLSIMDAIDQSFTTPKKKAEAPKSRQVTKRSRSGSTTATGSGKSRARKPVTL